jgi:hypothetical protein
MLQPALRRVAATAAVTTLALGGLTALAGPAVADPEPGKASNMGLCSSYLGKLPAPTWPPFGPDQETLGGNARSGVNLIIVNYGHMLHDSPANPGELYRVRARQHPTDPAEVECTKRGA